MEEHEIRLARDKSPDQLLILVKAMLLIKSTAKHARVLVHTPSFSYEFNYKNRQLSIPKTDA